MAENLAEKTIPAVRISVRNSLKASTIDGGLSTIFSNVTGGVLLSSFLLNLGANPFEIGLLASFPMLANLLQPLGALLSNRSSSRHDYGIWTFLPSRLIWLILLVPLILRRTNSHISEQLVYVTLTLVGFSSILSALGSASWMSWLAALVPAKLRGRYYSIRNVVGNIVSLFCLPIASFIISHWHEGAIAGYGIVLGISILAGVASLICQHFMIDINPQKYQSDCQEEYKDPNNSLAINSLFINKEFIAKEFKFLFYQNRNLVILLIYFSLWGFAVNLSTPFFNLYMLENLSIDITWVTLFSSLGSGANMLMLLVWGRISDRVGNRQLLIFAGLAIAITPLFWLFTGVTEVHSQLWIYLVIFHIFLGGSWAAIDLGSNNIQIEAAPIQHHAIFFALVSALTGISSALGTTLGGLLAQSAHYEGIFSIFFISTVLRLLALIPLLLLTDVL
ncbi:MFS transporter [Pseudanabaena sp. FACHB-1998]|nr:MFS transporter [Pseudanabaena sp. FACHB-1998]